MCSCGLVMMGMVGVCRGGEERCGLKLVVRGVVGLMGRMECGCGGGRGEG